MRLDVSGHRCPLPALKARRRLAELREAADKLLANPVMEDFAVEIIDSAGKTVA